MLKQTHQGFKYWMLFVDDHSRFRVVFLLKRKSDAFAAFRTYKSWVETQTGERVRCLRDDKGGEYMAGEFDAFCAEHGIERQHSVRNRPQQNGVAERTNRTLADGVTAMLAESGLPQTFWGEAVLSLVHVLNRSFTSACPDATPYELWYGRKPDVSHLRVWGCTAYVHVQKDKRQGLSPHMEKCVFIGYPEGYKGWKFYNPLTKRAVVSERAEFDERYFPGLKQPQDVPLAAPAAPPAAPAPPLALDDAPDLPDVPAHPAPHLGGEEQPQPAQNVPQDAPPRDPQPQPQPDGPPACDDSTPPEPGPSRARTQRKKREKGAPPTRSSSRSRRPPQPYWIVPRADRATPTPPPPDARAASPAPPASPPPLPELEPVPESPPPQIASPDIRAPSPGLWNAREPTPAIEDDSEDSYDFENDYAVNYVFANAYGHESATEYCNLGSEGEPLTYADAMRSPDKDKWLAAMREEIESHRVNGTWQVCALPPGKRAIGCKWVFRLKRNADGSIERYKARLVAQGFSQRPGFEYTEIFAPTIRLSTMRLILAQAALEDYHMVTVDISHAFINGDLDE